MINLENKFKIYLEPTAPFNFEGTVYNPSHFPTPTELYENGKWWQTMKFRGKILGLKLENKGATNRPEIALTVYSQKPLNEDFKNCLIDEIKYRFELDLDLSEFNKKFKKDKLLGPVIQRWLGMRSKCGYSLYESLMIYIVLQNATIRRTVQIMGTLLEKYGEKACFDCQKLYVFWEAKTMNKTSEEELRSLKVGYRAKFFKRISQSFTRDELEEISLRNMSWEEIRKRLLTLYGIGPASVGNLLWEVFHNHEILDIIPPWEQKIYSKLLHDRDSVPVEKILKDIKKRWGKWKRLTIFYLWTDLFWRHKKKSIPWLAKEIRL